MSFLFLTVLTDSIQWKMLGNGFLQSWELPRDKKSVSPCTTACLSIKEVIINLTGFPGSGRSAGEGNGNPFQYSCLEKPVDRGAVE